jgi:hypothetical protein
MADYKNFERVLRNIDLLNSQALIKKPEYSARDMLQYLQGEGYTMERFSKAAKNYADAKGLKSDYGFIDSGLQGLSFGFSDELDASIKTLINKKPYKQNLGAIQFSKQEFEAQNPISSAITEVGGSLPTALLGGEGTALALAKAAPKIYKAGAAVSPSMRALGTTTAGGTITGGIVGAGQAEEGGRIQGAKTGAQLGLLLSPAFLYGTKAVTGALSKTAQATGLTDATQRIVEATKNTPVVKNITGITAEFLGLTDDAIQRRADTKIIQALQRDKLTIDQVKTAMDTIRKSGYKPETIMEFGGDATKKLGEVVSMYPAAGSVAAKMVEERKAGAPERILTDFQQAFKTNADALNLADNLIKQREQLASPLYKISYEKNAIIQGQELDDFMKLPRFQDAYRKAQSLAEYDGKTLPSIKEIGNTFDLETANYVKRGLDDVIYLGKMPTDKGLGKDELNKLKDKKNEYIRFVDSLAPDEYKQARNQYSGSTSMIEAIEEGKNFFNLEARELKKVYDSYNPSEKDAFAVGAYDAIKGKINTGADGIDQVRRTFGSPEKRDQIKVLIGDDAFTTLEFQLAREKAIRGTDVKLIGGSPTQPRATAQADFEGGTELVPQLANKGLMRGATDYLIRATTGTGSRTAEQLAPDLFSINPNVQANMLNRLLNLDEYLKQQSIRQGTTTGITGGVAGQSLLD